MKNYINKNIDTSIFWSRNKAGDIKGLYIHDKKLKSPDSPAGYCGSIKINEDGTLEFFTDGHYQFITRKIASQFFAKILGTLGGKAKSPRKALSSKENGKKGGRP